MYRMDYPVVEPCFITVIGMAAPDMSRYLVEMNGEALKEIIKVRIERAFQIAYSNGNQAFLTGAWGCGESKCAPDIVAKAYAEVLEKWQYYLPLILMYLHYKMMKFIASLKINWANILRNRKEVIPLLIISKVTIDSS